MAFDWNLLGRNPTPKHLASFTTNAKHDVLKVRIGILNSERIFVLLLSRWHLRFVDASGIDSRQQKYSITPNDRRRATFALNRNFPFDIATRLFIPLERRRGCFRNARRIGASPLMPVVGGLVGSQRVRREYNKQDKSPSREVTTKHNEPAKKRGGAIAHNHTQTAHTNA
jgi:hypothetical protein